jgi:hypothetical protein
MMPYGFILALVALVSCACAAGGAPIASTYNPLPIALAITLLYSASWLASKKGAVSVHLHKQAWNLLLLLSFVALMAFSTILVLMVDSGFRNPLPIDVRFWHVEAGIAMVMIGAFHALWHISYFQAYMAKFFAGKKQDKRAESGPPSKPENA